MSNDTEVQHTYDKPQKENSALTGLKRAVRAAFHYSYLLSVWCIT
jgi:hypothetical protein